MKNGYLIGCLLVLIIACSVKPQYEATDDIKEIVSETNSKELDEKEINSLPIIPGLYNDGYMFLAYDGNLVTGYYAHGRYQGNPNFGCSFYFFGSISDKLAERTIKMKTLNPFSVAEKARKGTFKLHDEEDDQFSIVADLNMEECWDQNLGWSEIAESPGTRFDLITRQPWLEIRLAQSEKVYFHTDADETTRRKAYVVKNDPLFISERSGNWLKVTFIGANAETNGWVKLTDTIGLAQISAE